MQGNISLKGNKVADISWSHIKDFKKTLTHETFLIVIIQTGENYSILIGWETEFIRNLRAISVIRGKLQVSRAKSVIHSECKYKKELTSND